MATEEFLYSGIVKETADLLSDDWLWVYIRQGSDALQIQSKTAPVKIELTVPLNGPAEQLYRCLRKAMIATGKLKEP